MNVVTVGAPEDFRLRSSIEFLSRFSPQPVEASEALCFASPLPPSWEPVEVTVIQTGDALRVEWAGPAQPDAIVGHVQRVLSLDVDGSRFADVVDGDDALADVIDLDARTRPPLFWSPYEAAVWAVLSQRIRMTQASALKARLAAEHGFTPGSKPATPAPERLLAMRSMSGMNDMKLSRLHAVAEAALDGTLDPVALRSLPVDEALSRLAGIDGIGAFSAELILVRGAGAPDVFPAHERRLHAVMRQLYDQPGADSDDLAQLAAAWAPYRSWVAFHLRSWADTNRAHERLRPGERNGPTNASPQASSPKRKYPGPTDESVVRSAE